MSLPMEQPQGKGRTQQTQLVGFFTDEESRVRPIKPKSRTILVKPKTRTELKDKVFRLVEKYHKKAGLKHDVNVVFDKKGRKLADFRYRGRTDSYEIHINLKHLEEIMELNPKLAGMFLDYAIAHEISHIQQVEEHGPRAVANTPKFYVEFDAEKRTEKLSGISSKEVDAITSQLEKKLKEKSSKNITSFHRR
jgi:ribosome-associated translation inhibitor RaiA